MAAWIASREIGGGDDERTAQCWKKDDTQEIKLNWSINFPSPRCENFN